MTARRHLRELTYKVTAYVKHSTKTEEFYIRGAQVEITEHEEHSLFYILDAQNQTVFAMPYHQVVSCIAQGALKQPRKPKRDSASGSAAVVRKLSMAK